ncbi:hypothetical protein M409DRAFT_71433 [Zasmidium cellare ATCC 36951]|uniref:Uncharacterized protein n=1 Tax=Zasmidium cellare ATCC 36951 TaxID=1080233 RepID=A0A6A6BXY8_ZASCE|nr:uncharacterized protein M409DRAFT_71433 [Zasmidium cellare ATCC 36951]KAF2158800.1 hypothetical protein M409DRAFT_71433 [Zasmidium cellare ATCC 36951]
MKLLTVDKEILQRSSNSEPVAIVGMAMRLPGRVHTAADFWKLLTEKRSGLCDVPADRYNIDGFYDPTGKPGTVRTKQGYFLDDVDVQQFDTSSFPISRKEVERLDPEQRHLLEVAHECFEDSGATTFRGQKIGCYIGVFGEDWLDLNAKDTQHRGGYRVTGYGDFALANRISYDLDLHGPSMTIKTGCSSALVGLDLACQAIRNGDCDGALVGGVNLIFSPTMTLALSEQGVLSPTGTCKTFDAAADGYARGEAVNMLYVKRLSQALTDGDPIRAVIRGTSTNCDGRTQGMITPSSTSQEALIRRAYESAGIKNLAETALFECHGTGTSIGDPIEVSAVGRCFGHRGITITSVKPNVGHSEGAAGLTSLIKGILALEHRMVPPNINFSTPNPKIPFDQWKLHVPTEVEPWPQGRAERVSVNSFGIGGVNAHAIIESPWQYGLSTPTIDGGFAAEATDKAQLFLFSANGTSSLEENIDNHKQWLEATPCSLPDVAFTLANRREHKQQRAYAIGKSAASLETSAIGKVSASAPPIVFVFTGQGAQWPQMGVDLIDSNTSFRNTIKRLDGFLQSLPTPPPWTVENELRKTGESSLVHKAEMGHPLSIAVQIALIDVIRSWGIEPTLVLGHSSGEMAAAYASGSITAEGAMAAATFRGSSHNEGHLEGSMAAIGLGKEGVLRYMEPGVVVACENSQSSVTISGDKEQVTKVVEKIKAEQPGVLARPLKVEKAFHSHHMWELGPSYEQHIQPFVHSSNPRVPFFSSVTGQRLTGSGCLGASYWRQNMENPVLFNSSLRSALEDLPDGSILIEIGPHPALKGPIGQILRDLGRSQDTHLATLQRGKSDHESLLHLAGKLFQQGVPLEYLAFCPQGHVVSDLPRYAWKRETKHWLEPRIANQWRMREHPPHELLGSRVLEAGSEPCWRNNLALEDVPFIEGHQVNQQIVFPGAGYIAMITEALRQLEVSTSYTLRNVHLVSGLVLKPETVVEISTSLKRQMVDSSEQSSWYSFTISSYNGHSWVRNCFGEARAGVPQASSLGTAEVFPPLPRKVGSDAWYDVLKRQGFDYTGVFQGMDHISTTPTGNPQAIARVANTVPENIRFHYPVHPALIDRCFQLFTVAGYRGIGRDCTQIAVPTFIEEVVLSNTTEDLDVSAKIVSAERGSFVGDLTAQNGTHQVFSLKGFKASAVTSGDDAEVDEAKVSSIEWRQHADLADLSKAIKARGDRPEEWSLIEELVVLAALGHAQNLTIEDDTPVYLAKFLVWANTQVQEYTAGSNVFVPNSLKLDTLDNAQREARISEIMSAIAWSPYAVFAIAIHRLYEKAAEIFKGEVHPLHILMEDDVLTNFYAVGDFLDYSGLIKTLAHTNPQLRILEVGAGTGGTTIQVLDACKSSNGERMYGTYTYTDISGGFFPAAKERFAEYENMEYTVFDITKDPVQQGLELGSYDLIVAYNVVHATPSIKESLQNLRSLLNPQGRLLLQELCPDAKFTNYVMGFLSGWWLGDEDGRPEQPYISTTRWSAELAAAGFQAPEAIVMDRPVPYQSSAGILASAALRSERSTRVTLLSYAEDSPFVKELSAYFQSQGVEVDICRFGEALPEGQDVVSLLDLQAPLVHDLDSHSFQQLFDHLKTLKTKMIWLTRSAQVNCQDPRNAMILGLARTARNEMSLKLFTVEVDDACATPFMTDAVGRILWRINTLNIHGDATDPDWEYALVKDEILVPRIHWQDMSDALTKAVPETESSSKTLNIRTPGLLQTMEWVEEGNLKVGNDEVLVDIKATGLNFRDVLIALGVLENSTRELGLEGAGVVHTVGSKVGNIRAGDRVMFMSSGCFSTQKIVPASACVRIDDSMSFEQAAGMPCVYATAAMALVDKARIQPGQTLLIHSACGGVGLAALEIAGHLGANIYCTVGSERKIQYLMDNYGIERSHIFNSRDSSFLPDVMAATKGRGVDVVLNSLSGELLEASWKCVAEFGTMIEIGKRDFRRRAKLAMEAFEANRTFVGLDLFQVAFKQPKQAAELLDRCVEWIRNGSIKPMTIADTFSATAIRDAFRFMQGGQHIGKIVVTMPEDVEELQSSQALPEINLRGDRSYLLVGGLGGLGRAVATWMVERGARHLIFMSRSAGDKSLTAAFEDELAAQGCQVQFVQGSVVNAADVEQAVNIAAAPIAGAINMSMVLRDIALPELTYPDWKTCVEPKVNGTWNLHKYLPSELDFFILFSSYSGIAGQWGQANYSAANTFLDAFVQHRHGLGQSASVIDIGAMGEVGFVSQNQDIMTKFHKTGMRLLTENNLLNAMALAILRSTPHDTKTADGGYLQSSQILTGFETVVPISSPTNRVAWKRDVRMSIYHNINGATETSTSSAAEEDGLKALLSSAEAKSSVLSENDGAEANQVIAKGLASALSHILVKDEDSMHLDQPPEALGVDSLVAMEVRNWIRKQTAADISVFIILQSTSLLDLANNIRTAVLARLEASS